MNFIANKKCWSSVIPCYVYSCLPPCDQTQCWRWSAGGNKPGSCLHCQSGAENNKIPPACSGLALTQRNQTLGIPSQKPSCYHEGRPCGHVSHQVTLLLLPPVSCKMERRDVGHPSVLGWACLLSAAHACEIEWSSLCCPLAPGWAHLQWGLGSNFSLAWPQHGWSFFSPSPFCWCHIGQAFPLALMAASHSVLPYWLMMPYNCSHSTHGSKSTLFFLQQHPFHSFSLKKAFPTPLKTTQIVQLAFL